MQQREVQWSPSNRMSHQLFLLAPHRPLPPLCRHSQQVRRENTVLTSLNRKPSLFLPPALPHVVVVDKTCNLHFLFAHFQSRLGGKR